MKQSFNRILIANRGEIACRIINTARAMGLSTVTIGLEHERFSRHAQASDEHHTLTGDSLAASYLKCDQILSVAKKSGAQAIHPGYGFLSENAAFAQAVRDAGLIFIGPAASVIAKMGSKTLARDIMAKAGVPITPGYQANMQDLAGVSKAADQMGYPVLVKASAGGGGKGMRLVESQGELLKAIQQAASEAERSFKDDSVYLEKLLAQPRHIEVQVIADEHGNALHLYERECSVQRRYQKIIEESPSPALDAKVRSQITQTAVKAIKSIGYTNAGTLEFLLDDQGHYYFLEMNTRLQVEHPITEWVTGVDLVRLQLAVALGQKLPLAQAEIQQRGCALECRVYAEDPQQNFFPTGGKIVGLAEPMMPFVRVDSALCESEEIGTDFDPMLAKVSTWGSTRPEAISRMRLALANYKLLGFHHNIGFLRYVLASPAFTQGKYSTKLVEEIFAGYPHESAQRLKLAGLIKGLADAAGDGMGPADRASAGISPRQANPWQANDHFRMAARSRMLRDSRLKDKW